MPRVPYVFPPAGSDAVADAIRQRRGARGLTSLDGMLLNAPPIAQGWNTLLGAVRTGSLLEGDLREIMVCLPRSPDSARGPDLSHTEPVVLTHPTA